MDNKVFKNKGKDPENSIDEQWRSKQVEKKFEWVGTRFDCKTFDKLAKERWVDVEGSVGMKKCLVHGNVFKPDGDDEVEELEPCWGCYNECVTFIK